MTLVSRFPEICATADRRTADVVDRTGLHLEAAAKARARVRTGFMRAGIEWHPNGHEGELRAGASYTYFNEYGTRYMSAQPMFVPAAEVAWDGFLAGMGAVYR